MTDIPPPPTPPVASSPAGNPFERRSEVGFLGGLLRTFGGFVAAPGRTFAETRRRGDWGSPLIFGVIVLTVALVVGQSVQLLVGPALGPAFDPAMELGVPPGAIVLGLLVAGPLIALVSLFFNAGLIHLFLLLVGGAARSQAGFEGTLRAVAYATPAQVAVVVPLIGGLIAFIWAVLLEVVGLVELHGTTHGRAIAAVLLPLALLCGCGMAIVLLAIGVGGLASLAGGG